ncbi:hypothetical protein C8R47DRAFT_608502 [Mycena vitilis]|nr:hypothetical protein C8R47DRAFT_608502 [Mycena vitilis]
MTTNTTCFRRKTKKHRCDGSNPCNSCSAAGKTCGSEERAKKHPLRLEMHKGQACLACRRKKKRCDGKRPCQTCAYSRGTIRCEYSNGTLVTLALRKTRAKPPSGSTDRISLEGLECSSYKTVSDLSAATDSSPESSVVGSSAQSRIFEHRSRCLSSVDICLSMAPPMPQLISSGNDHGDLAASYSPPPLEGTPSHLFVPNPSGNDTLYPSQHMLLELASAENDGGDRIEEELPTIRQLFLHQRFQLGLSARGTTLASLANGVDEPLVHTALFHACQLLGYMFAYHLKYKTWRCHTQAATAELRLAIEALPHPACPVACLQAVNLLSLYCFHLGDIEQARNLIRTGNVYVREHALGSVTPAETERSTFTIEPTTAAEETHAAVAQLAYLDLAYAVALELPIIDPVLHAKIRARFLSNPNCSVNTEMNSVRAKTVFLLFEAQQLAVRWYQNPGLHAEEAAEWQQSYWDLMESLDAHRSLLTLTLTRIAFAPALRTVGISLKVCAVLVLTGLDTLLALFSCGNVELQQKRHAVLAEINSIGRLFEQEDCDNMEPLLTTCWTSIVGTLDEYTAARPESAKTMQDISVLAALVRALSRAKGRHP